MTGSQMLCRSLSACGSSIAQLSFLAVRDGWDVALSELLPPAFQPACSDPERPLEKIAPRLFWKSYYSGRDGCLAVNRSAGGRADQPSGDKYRSMNALPPP